MNRLLQGDVGSGKTIVVLLAAMFVVSGGHQVAIIGSYRGTCNATCEITKRRLESTRDK